MKIYSINALYPRIWVDTWLKDHKTMDSIYSQKGKRKITRHIFYTPHLENRVQKVMKSWRSTLKLIDPFGHSGGPVNIS